MEATSAPPTNQNQDKTDHPSAASDPSLNMGVSEEAGPEPPAPLRDEEGPAATEPVQEERPLQAEEQKDPIGSAVDGGGAEHADADLGPRPASPTMPWGEEAELPGPSRTAPEPLPQQRPVSTATESEQSPAPAAAAGPRARRDKLARLRELGLDPPPVPKLCADEGAFIHLEPPLPNPGEQTPWSCVQRPED